MRLTSNGVAKAQPKKAAIRQYILVFLTASLSCTVVLKIGEVQYLELIYAVDSVLLISLFLIQNDWRFRVFRPYLSIGKSYGIFLGCAFGLGVLALRQNFFLLNDSLFKKPLLLTISRMGELFFDVFYMLYFASLYREDQELCAFGAKIYYWTSIVGGIYCIVTYPLNVLFDTQLGTYGDSHRFRGFNNEGGSYGVYLVSVCVLTIVMRHQNWLTKRQFYFGMGTFLVCLVGSQSKSALLAIVLTGLLSLLWMFKGLKRWGMIAVISVPILLMGSVFNFQQRIEIYLQASAQYQRISQLRSEDGNFVMGRVAGAVLAPRMIAAHPLAGVGWGNYPLIRDDPQYRQGTAFSLNSGDAPGLGFIDYIVDLGFPLWIYLTWVELKPVYLLRRHGANLWVAGLAMMLPISNWVGAHLNLIHPWVVLGFALGIGFRRAKQSDFPQEVVDTGT